jgi:homoserine kinase
MDRGGEMCRVRVPATTANIGPGFDCLGFALNLYNYIEMDFSIRPNVEVFGEGRDYIAKDETNLVYRAARRVLELVGDNRPLSIALNNNIPIARGLGSSAACVAGGMMAANRLIKDCIPLKKLMQMAVEMEGHPDNVVPALIGGFCISMANNKKIIYRKIEPAKHLKFVVGIPEFHLKTEAARSALPSTVSLKDAVFNIGRTAMLVASFCTEDMTEIDDCFKDKLHQPYRSPLVPGMEEIINYAYDKGAIGCFLSGAGPSVIGITNEQNAEELGSYICGVFDKNGVRATYKVLSSCNEGVEYE